MFNYQNKIQQWEILESDNPLIKKILIIIDVEDLRQQRWQREEERPPTPMHYQSEEEYHSRSE